MISNSLIVNWTDSNLITLKSNSCLLNVYQIFLQKLKIWNARSYINQWDLPDEFLPNGESLSKSKTSKTEKYEDTKTAKLDRTN